MKDTIEIIIAEFEEVFGIGLPASEFEGDSDFQYWINYACIKGRSDLAQRLVNWGRENNFRVGMPN